MKHISSDAYLNNTSALVLALSQEAKEKKAQGIKVIDTTIGMLLDDNGKLSSLSLIDDALKNVKISARGYPSVNGGELFNQNNLKWLFKEFSDSVIKKYNVSSIATIGGTGALYLSFRNYIDKNCEILLPDIGWGNYASIAHLLNHKHDYYQMFDKDCLNIQSIKDKVNNAIKKYQKAIILINDPAHNPSGYSISKDEWINLINYFNEIGKDYPLTLILDAAYIDYSKDSRLFFSLINETKINFLTLVAMSYSKTFTMYGMRLGALVAISSFKEDIIDFNLAVSSTTRATYSCPNGYAIDAFNKVMKKSNFKIMENYFNKKQEMINVRYKKALSYFSKLFKGKALPYKEGFFLTFKVDNANKIADKLKKKNIYVLPMQDKYIRVAICSFINY